MIKKFFCVVSGNKSSPMVLLYASRIFTKLAHNIVHGEVQHNHVHMAMASCLLEVYIHLHLR
jgi:hypothetical protein